MSEDTDQPNINISQAAAEQIAAVIKNHENAVSGLKIQIQGRAEGKFQHLLSMVEEGAEPGSDQSVEIQVEGSNDGITVFYPARDSFYLNDLVIDWETAEDGTRVLSSRIPTHFGRTHRNRLSTNCLKSI